MPNHFTRRAFLSSAVRTGAGLLILPSGIMAGTKRPNEKLNIALIGVWGRGIEHYSTLKRENVVALCDINEARFPDALKHFPQAKTYVDWRKCLDHPGLDAVVICTTDHTHAFIANWAMHRDLHVYCEKPLGISVEQARILRDTWLTKKGKLATQSGTQLHAEPNLARVRELIRDGAIGQLVSASAWGNRQIRRSAYLPAAGQPPAGLHWDLWLGPAPQHPYNPGYFGNFQNEPEENCLEWNMFWDFGAGQTGDMGSHTMDIVWNAIDATLPTSAEASGDPFNPDVTPVELEAHFEHPANDWRGPIRVSWYQGGRLPRSPKKFIDLKSIGHGAIFKGSQGFLVADFTSRLILPYGPAADLSYFQPRKKENQLPPVGHFSQQWIDACKNPSLKTSCDFEYSANMTEQMLLGLVAYRAGKKLEYDAKTGKITNSPEANLLLSRPAREGWTLNG